MGVYGRWRFDLRMILLFIAILSLFYQNPRFCWSLNDEGLALLKLRDRIEKDPFGALSNWNENDIDMDPCSWFGVECSNGNVVIINLNDLSLQGTLAPEIKNLAHLKFMFLRNNSFSGYIPKEIGELEELQVLDLGYNNFSGQCPFEFDNNLSLTTLLLDNNKFLGRLPRRRLVQAANFPIPQGPDRAQAPELPSQFESAYPPSPSPFVSADSAPSPLSPSVSPAISIPPWTLSQVPKMSNSKHQLVLILAFVFGAAMVLVIAIVLLYRRKTVVIVRPWATGLSGQLQKAFVTGVPKLKRAELEVACEDFSNIIGSFPDGTIYKGTLSDGIEIAVTSSSISSRASWTKNLEAQFRKKIDTLSKINHKNFMNLIGFCEENRRFTRMMVFEYAPNGTLFEHLHIREAEHLDWGTRVRIAMGIAYCLDHMHQLNPPITHKNLKSSSVYLTEDYAAKVGDLVYWDEPKSVSKTTMEVLESSTASNVYSFGVILYELISGRSSYLASNVTVDPTLVSFDKEMFEKLVEVIKVCVDVDPSQRPTMRDVVAKLRQITAMGPDIATPKLSPLWWAELEIMSVDSC